jgi:hypothetical protein
MFLLALASLGAADAAPFATSDIPYTTTFSFDWTGIVSGSTTYTFETQTRVTASTVCDDVPGCMFGDFTTGNSGEGSYSTDLRVDNCTTVAGPFAGPFGSVYFDIECDVTQTLEFTYVDTTGAPLATYEGEAICGTLNAERYFFFGFLVGTFNRSYSVVPGLYSGTMSTPGGFTGTFTE